MEDKKDVLEMYVNDMLAVEKHILSAVERQAESADVAKFPEAKQLVSTICSTLEQHTSQLENYMHSQLGTEESMVKKAVGTVAGIAAGLYDQIRADKVSRMLRDDYTALSLASVSYHMLMTTAISWNEQQLAQLAEKNLNDLTGLVTALGQNVCDVVAKELTEEGKVPNPNAGKEAQQKTHQAWTSPFAKAASSMGVGSSSMSPSAGTMSASTSGSTVGSAKSTSGSQSGTQSRH